MSEQDTPADWEADGDEGNAVVEIKEGRVRTVVNASGRSGYAGDGGPAREALLAGPKYVSLDRRGRLLIADTENHCIRRYDPEKGTIATVAGVPTKAGASIGADLLATQLARPHGCCLDPAGRLVIADVIPPGVNPIRDAAALLTFATRGGFLVPAFAGLVRTALSDYGKIRKSLGFSMYAERDFIDLLSSHGLTAKRVHPNFGHNQARMTFSAQR
jgi:hypothetical protein